MIVFSPHDFASDVHTQSVEGPVADGAVAFLHLLESEASVSEGEVVSVVVLSFAPARWAVLLALSLCHACSLLVMGFSLYSMVTIIPTTIQRVPNRIRERENVV